MLLILLNLQSYSKSNLKDANVMIKLRVHPLVLSASGIILLPPEGFIYLIPHIECNVSLFNQCFFHFNLIDLGLH